MLRADPPQPTRRAQPVGLKLNPTVVTLMNVSAPVSSQIQAGVDKLQIREDVRESTPDEDLRMEEA